MKQHMSDLCIQTQQQSGSHPHISPHSGAVRIQSTQIILFVLYIIDILARATFLASDLSVYTPAILRFSTVRNQVTVVVKRRD